MKKLFLTLSIILTTIVFFSCNTPCEKNNALVGKWERTLVDSVSTTYMLEITENQEWKYFKGEELLEEGPFTIEENIFIMKHAVEEHSHEGEDHEHEHADEHKYEYSLNEDQTELSFITEEKTTVFTKVK